MERSLMNFSSKLKKSSHAINYPFKPEIHGSVAETIERMQKMIDNALTRIDSA
jgi:hypothetical protein